MKGGYWDVHTNLPKHYDIYMYAALDTLGNELIQASARKQGIDPLELLRSIEKDMFMGGSSGLRQLMEPFGTHAKSLLVHVSHKDHKLVRELAFDLGLPEAAAKMDALYAGASVDILGWVRDTATTAK